MGVPTSEVGYTSATIGRGSHEVHKGHVVALRIKKNFNHALFKYGRTQCLFSGWLIIYEEIIEVIYISPVPRIVVPRVAYLKHM
jgi:hypothetical protein